MKSLQSRFLTIALAALIALTSLAANSTFVAPATAATTNVVVIVDGNAITNYDIQRRIAFLKIQRQEGDLEKIAREELIDETLKTIEMKRRDLTIPQEYVQKAYADFASRNHMNVMQLSNILEQAGVTPEHFQSFIMSQMAWGRLVSARFRAENGGTGMISEEEAVQRMIKNGGVKPTTKEYKLQQIIFVIPANASPDLLQKRLQDAQKFQKRFSGCATSKILARNMIDVTVRDLGRILEPQLPVNWEQQIKKTPAGKLTSPIETANGLEALAVCQIQTASDDRVAQLLFSIEDLEKGDAKAGEEISKNYLQELRDNARIQKP